MDIQHYIEGEEVAYIREQGNNRQPILGIIVINETHTVDVRFKKGIIKQIPKYDIFKKEMCMWTKSDGERVLMDDDYIYKKYNFQTSVELDDYIRKLQLKTTN